RRHTRSKRDWSSDVCSSDLPPAWPNVELTQTVGGPRSYYAAIVRPRDFQPGRKYPVILYVYGGPTITVVSASLRGYLHDQWMAEIGRASCRESVEESEGGEC